MHILFKSFYCVNAMKVVLSDYYIPLNIIIKKKKKYEYFYKLNWCQVQKQIQEGDYPPFIK